MPPEKKTEERILALDGLRGISILWVLSGHALASGYKSPFFLLDPLFEATFGVKIFFVISGYVITTLLIQEKKISGRISWSPFILKRLTKLFPTLAVVVLTTAIVAAFGSVGCPKSSYPIALFFLTEIFGTRCWELAHTWSLSVEEIFYLGWMPAVSFLNRKSFTRLLFITILIAPLVRVFNYAVTGPYSNHFAAVPFLSNVDLLGFGALAALVFNEGPSKLKAFAKGLGPVPVCLLVVLLYCASIVFFRLPYFRFLKYFALPFGSSLQGAVMAVILLHTMGNTRSSPVNRILSIPLLVFLGRISYSLYLWQQLLLNPFDPPWLSSTWHGTEMLGRVLTALLVGTLSYFFFEAPMMKFLRKKLCLRPSILHQTSSSMEPKSTPSKIAA